MTVAASANDLQLLSGGRFLLGLGSQIKPHITKRYSMPWSAPAARMREFVLALHAIWDSWETGEQLQFLGEFYTHTLMTPIFSPGPNPYGRPPVYLAGVGPAMTETAGEVADGFICHPFTTRQYIHEVTLPALEKGRARAEREISRSTSRACRSRSRATARTSWTRPSSGPSARWRSTARRRLTVRCWTCTASAAARGAQRDEQARGVGRDGAPDPR